MSSNTPFCVIGHPLGHSMSPFIHDRLFGVIRPNGLLRGAGHPT